MFKTIELKTQNTMGWLMTIFTIVVSDLQAINEVLTMILSIASLFFVILKFINHFKGKMKTKTDE